MSNYNEFLEMIFEKSVELILVFRENGEIIQANSSAKQETGYGEEIYNVSIFKIYPNIFTKSKMESIKEFNNYETVVYCNNQVCFPVVINLFKTETDMGIIGICLAMNISERKAAIQKQKKAITEIEEVTKMKNEFMANVTHELRTPVNGLKGLVGTLFDTKLTKEQLDTLNIIMRCCDNMSKIINDLLDMSKIEAGKLIIEKREFNFYNFINDLVALHTTQISEKGLKFSIEIGHGIPTNLIGDELRLGQIIQNLLSNAIKFTGVGNIALEVVKTYESNTEIELFFMIMDTGIGMPLEDIDKLFQPFSQIDGSITRRFGGTGLGLSICKKLVESMGGRIHVHSELGKGTTFSFSVRLELEEMKGSYFERKSEFCQEYIGGHDLYLEEKNGNYLEIIHENLEKLLICVDLEAWEKAEIFAGIIKNSIPNEKQELKKAAFRVELCIRKSDYNKSIEKINELQEFL